MARFWSVLAVQLGKRAGLVSVIGLIVTVGLGFGITRLEFATGQDSYLNKSDQVYKDNVAYQKLFGGQAMLSVISMDDGHKVDELFDSDGTQRFEKMAKTLTDEGTVLGIITPLTALQFSHNLVASPDGNVLNAIASKALLSAQTADPTEAGKAARAADTTKTLGRLGAVAGPQELSNPEWVKFLLYNNDGEVRKALRPFFPDTTHALAITRLKGNQSIDQEGAAAADVESAAKVLKFPDAQVTTTGASVLLRDLNDYLRGGMLFLGGIAVAIMILILLVLFDVRWRLLPMLVILIGVTWAFGLAGYLGIPLTIVTIAGLPVMLGVGIDYAIQMHARVEEEVVGEHNPHPIQETSRNLGPALLVVTFDAIFAFAALRFAKVPMIRQFGLLLALGIAVICFCSIIVPLATLGIREYKSPTKGREFREGVLGRLVVWLGSVPTSAAIPFILASIVIFLGGAAVEGKLVLQTDPVKWVNQSSQVIKDLDTIHAEVGGSSEFGVFVRHDNGEDLLSDQKSVDYIDRFTRTQMDRWGPSKALVVGTSIVASVSDIINDVPGGSVMSPRAEDVTAAYGVAPPDMQRSTSAEGGSAANIVFLTGEQALKGQKKIIEAIRHDVKTDLVPPTGLSAVPSGLAVVGVGLLDNLEANRILLTYLSVLFVFLFLAFRLRSIIRSLLSLVPVLIATGAASLIAWVLGLELSPMTAVGGPLVVAVCTEFTSLILLRFVEERRRGLEPRAAADVAASRTGRAFIVSACTAIAGIGVIATSSLPLLRDFGIIVAMNVAVALASALVVLPPMLVWADAERRGWVSRGLMRPHDHPYIPTDHRV